MSETFFIEQDVERLKRKDKAITKKQTAKKTVAKGNSVYIPKDVATDITVSTNSSIANTLCITGNNLLPLASTGTTYGGITYTVNADKSITITGTATTDSMFTCVPIIKKYLKRFVGRDLIINCDITGTITGLATFTCEFLNPTVAIELKSNKVCASNIIRYSEKTGKDTAFFYIFAGVVVNLTLKISMQEYVLPYVINTYEPAIATEVTCPVGSSIIIPANQLSGKTIFSETDTSTIISTSYNSVSFYSAEEAVSTLNSNNILYGKIALFNGDSITYGGERPVPEDYMCKGWCKYVTEKNKMTLGGYGIGGTTITKIAGRTNSILERIDIMQSTADYVIFQGGVNDTWWTPTLTTGVISTGYSAILDETTFCGALESIFKKALLKWSGAKIGFITTHRINTAEPSLSTYMEQAKLICAKWSIPCLDLHSASGLCGDLDAINTTYFVNSDRTHPNELGYSKFLNSKVEEWMRSL